MFKLTLCLIAALTVCAQSADVQILRQASDVSPDGSYVYSYETSDGAQQEQSGHEHFAKGSAKWVDPQGEQISLTYVADENGYQPQGAHLPTPPPVPAHILKAIEWIAAHPPKDE